MLNKQELAENCHHKESRFTKTDGTMKNTYPCSSSLHFKIILHYFCLFTERQFHWEEMEDWIQVCSDSSMHGLRFVCDRGSHFIRRCVFSIYSLSSTQIMLKFDMWEFAVHTTPPDWLSTIWGVDDAHGLYSWLNFMNQKINLVLSQGLRYSIFELDLQ